MAQCIAEAEERSAKYLTLATIAHFEKEPLILVSIGFGDGCMISAVVNCNLGNNLHQEDYID